MRNYDMEKKFLLEIAGLNYALLQRDWDCPNHGDLDIVLSADDWSAFVDCIIGFTKKHNLNIVKAYEIEYGIVCIAILANGGFINLDISIAPFRRKIFKLDLACALKSREMISGCFVVSKEHENIYKTNKLKYKHNIFSVWVMRLMNLKVIFERLSTNLILMRGVIIYIPYVCEIKILEFDIVAGHVVNNLTNRLLRKYSPE